MKVIAYCGQCAHQHGFDFDPLKPSNDFTDWRIKHHGHERVGFNWLQRTVKPSWVDAIREFWKFVKWKTGYEVNAGPVAQFAGIGPDAIAAFLHNADVKISYAASSDFTITLASLASSSSLLAGRESTSISNTTNKYLDYAVAGKITVGTTPTANTQINVAVVGQSKDSTWPDVFDGTDSAETVTNQQFYDQICKLASTIQVVATTSDIGYPFGPTSIASLFGGQIPKEHVLFVSHNTVAALNATGGNHVLSVTPSYLTVV